MKKCYVVLGLFLLFFGATNSATATMIGSYEGHDYLLVLKPAISWSEASADFKNDDGWHLATISSPEEEAFIEKLIESNTTVGDRDEYWLGGSQDLSSVSEKWDWVNNEGTFWNNGAIQGVYSNFWGSEPNNSGRNPENWLALDYRKLAGGFVFNDEGNLGYIHGYVAERVSAPVPEPATLVLFGFGIFGLAIFKRKFRRN